MRSNQQPEIRFPGFFGNWNQCELGDIANFSKGNGYSKSDLTDEGNSIILYGRLYTKYETVIKAVDTFTKIKEKSVISKGNEVIVPSSGETSEDISRASFVSVPGVILGGDLNIIRPGNEIDPIFLALTISNGEQQKELSKRAQGKSVVHLHNSDLKKVNLVFPKREEQTIIGNFFEKLDATIALYMKELATLKQTKQEFLKKMFPKKEKLVPEVRFKGFTGEWKQRKLSDITKLITKGTTPKDKSNIGDINFIKVENIDSGSGAVSITSKISKEEHDGYLKRSKLETGDILFSIAGTLGRVTIVDDDMLPANTNQALAIIRLKEGNVDFIATYLKGKFVEDYIRKNPTVGAQPNLSLQQVGDLTIISPNKQEQEKIGALFKQLDNTIALYQRELDALKETKKTFLQKMFV
ncbi:restriction endonuclease subunit S [Rossellomorea vietnamensis]|uniref:restriction endonuclease subunit S n=1 Tax=Rossellomorea vietnamensis TaxID=218284 RepID=UPI0009EEAAE1|nr:restriction endonuclease subunit S [Rossellomorea vietnamensis]